MLYTKIQLRPDERAIILLDGKLHDVCSSGRHTVWHFGKECSVIINKLSSLAVEWKELAACLRFQREKAEQFWQIIDSPIGTDTLVWHDRYLVPQIIPSGESRAFWKPENGEIHTCPLPQEAFRLPENVEADLLRQPRLQAPLRKYTVSAKQKMLVAVRGELQAVFGTGQYVLRVQGDEVKVLFADSASPVFDDAPSVQMWAKANPGLVAEHFDCVAAGADELKLYFVGDVLTGCIAPDTHAYFWKQAAAPYAIQTVDLKNGLRIDADTQAKLKAANFWQSSLAKIVYFFQVPAQHQGLLYIDQQLQPVLPAGEYYYWMANRQINAEIIDLRPQTCEISGQELLSEDKVTLRVNAVCNYRITDAPLWLAQHREPEQYLYRELQFAIRAVVGGKTMDQLLADKQAIDAELSAAMRAKNLHGIEIDGAGVKDIILPGEIRTILTRVVEAEKSALANNIRRREETASTRSLLNTARVMEENPVALRLKELETLEKVTEKIDKISVYGGLDGVLNGLININTPKS